MTAAVTICENKLLNPNLTPNKLDWKDDWSVGNDELDQQHQVLIGYINELNDLNIVFQSGKFIEHQDVADIFIKISTYTVTHFKAEEQLLERYNYPGLKKHKEIHQKLIAQLEHLERRFEEVGLNLIPPLLQFLNVWLKEHILGVDKKYSLYVGKRDHLSNS
jgi:hemerythrin